MRSSANPVGDVCGHPQSGGLVFHPKAQVHPGAEIVQGRNPAWAGMQSTRLENSRKLDSLAVFGAQPKQRHLDTLVL